MIRNCDASERDAYLEQVQAIGGKFSAPRGKRKEVPGSVNQVKLQLGRKDSCVKAVPCWVTVFWRQTL